MKHFTIIELGADSESPMIGTIDNVTDDKMGRLLFKERLIKALSEHFDLTINGKYLIIPNLFTGSPYEDITVSVEDVDYEIRILETWIY